MGRSRSQLGVTRSRRRAIAHALESRRLLASSLAGDVLTILGTDAADDIRLDVDPTYINLLRVRINASVERFLLGDYTKINLRAAGGNDRIELGDLSAAGHPKYMTVDAGDGDDNVIGSPYADRLSGGDGTDSIRGNDGNDTLHGDEGNDTLKGDTGDDQVNGDAGDDQLSDNTGRENLLKGGDGRDRIAFELDALGHPSFGRGNGGAGNDTLSGLFDRDSRQPSMGLMATLYGDDGDDTLYGSSIDGGRGNDRLIIRIYATAFVVGGDGADTITGASGGFIDAGSGNDLVEIEGSWRGESTIQGGSGDDRLTFVTSRLGPSGGAMNGGEGDDTLQGASNPDSLHGEAGNDEIHGAGGADSLYGGAGRDTLFGGDGSDSLFGDAGDDHLYGGRSPTRHKKPIDGNDTADGGKGRDWLDARHAWLRIKPDENDAKTGAKPLFEEEAGDGLTGYIDGWYPPNDGLVPSAYNNFSTSATTYSGLDGPRLKPSPDGKPFRTVHARLAAFGGVVGAKPAAAKVTAAAAAAPLLTDEERSQMLPGVLHLPADWRLERISITTSGLAWYRVQTDTAPFVLMKKGNTVTKAVVEPGTSAYSIKGVATNAVTLLGILPTTLVLLNLKGAADDVTQWPATTGWRSRTLTTSSTTRAFFPGVNSVLTFARSDFSALPDQPAGTRAIVTLQGLILIDKAGARFAG